MMPKRHKHCETFAPLRGGLSHAHPKAKIAGTMRPMRSFFGRLGVALALFVLGCSIEHPTERDAGACGISGTPCCRLDAGIRLDASGLMSNGCGNGLSCVSGTCQACPSGQQLCNGACVAVTDRNNCGACGNACMSGFDCLTSAGDAGAPSCERVCPPGQNRCGGGAQGICTDLAMDTVNCGTCGTSCAARMLPNVATPACNAGMCAVGVCAANFANCDMAAANGCEVNTQTSTDHCGGCGRQCATPPNAVPVCRAGACDFTCMAGFSDCDRNPANGCETNLNTDARNCMMCGRACPTQPGQTATCSGGTCGFTMTLMCPAGTGNCDMNAANGCETNTVNGVANMSQIDHCGACGNTCNFPFAASRCLGGTCAIGMCTAGRSNCDGDEQNGCEVILATSTSNCGACGAFCPRANNNPTCVAGVCQLGACLANFANCDGNVANGCEVDVRTSAQHCGRCGNACGAGQQCLINQTTMMPTCTLVCPTGQTVCGGRCVDVNTDNGNCGACGTACGPGQVCSDRTCRTNCGPGQTNCSGTCRDLTNDRANCNACGRVCGAGESCVNSVCTLVCPTGQTACSGTCRDLTNDAANCNACGTTCSGRFANSAPSCVASACALGTCNAGFANCDNNNGNGCEANTNTNTTHCGACGNTCSFPNAGATCSNGRCALGACNSGFGNCDGIAENGCETNLNTAVNNCRTCGNVCSTTTPGLVPVCTSGTCGTALGTCPTGRADCNGNAGDGCEVETSTSLANCGGCGQACARTNASVSCTGGVCLLGTCTTGFGNCDGDAVNGCETNTTTSTTHCGGCGRPCFFANAAATCASGTCALGACTTGFANCDSNGSNGCEAALQSDRNNCGACGRQCASGEVCSAGVCTVQCQSGQSNCSGSCVNTATDRANCGTCGTACAAGRICQGGTCILSCPSGQTACGSSCVNTQTDSANCNACGNLCTGGRVCSSGMCTCPSGQTLCGGTCFDLQTSGTHCGMCNRACTSGQVCSAGSCVSTCQTGTVNCSGSCVNTLTSTAHCGPVQPSTCGMACTLANAVNTCSGGTCGFSSCNTGFANCNNTSSDGCEVNITSSATNCNGCNNNCNTLTGVASASCVSSACANLVCITGRADCNSNTGDGCETTLSNDRTNCGACNNDCNDLPQVATSTCSSSACNVSTCDTNFGNCDNVSSNGCEADLRISAANCGACGAACPSGTNNTLNNDCLSGQCNCVAGFGDCDSNRTNGCETNRQASNQHCGNCGVPCTGAGNTCAGGTCQSACGEDTEPCCAGDACGSNLACVMGTCTAACGASMQPCCTGNSCNGGLTCTAGTCTP
jgi:hypothetical protein